MIEYVMPLFEVKGYKLLKKPHMKDGSRHGISTRLYTKKVEAGTHLDANMKAGFYETKSNKLIRMR